MFSGLDCMKDSYPIRLMPDAQPNAVHAPRRILEPLLPKVKEELDRLLHFGVISSVDKPTEWCAP